MMHMPVMMLQILRVCLLLEASLLLYGLSLQQLPCCRHWPLTL